MKISLKFVLLFLPFVGEASSGTAESFEISVPQSGAKIESLLFFSKLKGTYIIIPDGALQRKTTFSIVAQSDECPKLPKNRFDISPTITLGPQGVRFQKRLKVHLSIPSDYVPTQNRVSIKKTTHRKSPELWKTDKNRQWKKALSVANGANFVEFSPSIFDTQCYVVTAAR